MSEWIPIKMRPTTEEEKKESEEIYDFPCEFYYECPLPEEDEQEVLVTTRWGNVEVDTFYSDGNYFEKNDDAGDVIAWMPFPEPYEENKNE